MISNPTILCDNLLLLMPCNTRSYMAFYFSLAVKEELLVNEKSVVKEKNFYFLFSNTAS